MGNFTLPSGFRFLPTDKQLVGDYLKNKILKNPLPCDILKEVNVYDQHPKDLCGYRREGEPAMYFFSPRERKYPHGSRPNRKAGQGFWKASGVSSTIKIDDTVATKRTLVYHTGNNKDSVKTDWLMNEYVMKQNRIRAISKPDANRNSRIALSSNAVSADNNMKLDDWVLCKVYNKAWKSKNKNEPTSPNAIPEVLVQTNDVDMQKSNDEVDSGSLAPPLMQRTDEDLFVFDHCESPTQISPLHDLQLLDSQVFSTNLSPETGSGLHVGSSSSAPAMRGPIGGVLTESGGGSTSSLQIHVAGSGSPAPLVQRTDDQRIGVNSKPLGGNCSSGFPEFDDWTDREFR